MNQLTHPLHAREVVEAIERRIINLTEVFGPPLDVAAPNASSGEDLPDETPD